MLEFICKRPDIFRGLAERGIDALISRVADEERDAWTTLNRSLRSWRRRGGFLRTFWRHSGARRALRAGQGSEPLARGIARPFAASRLVFGRRQHGFEVFARFVGLALSFVGKSPVREGGKEVGIKPDGFIEIGNRSIVFTLVAKGEPARVECKRVLGIEPDRLIEVCDSAVIFTSLPKRIAAPEICLVNLWIELEGFAVIGDGAIEVTLLDPDLTTPDEKERKPRGERNGLIAILQRAVEFLFQVPRPAPGGISANECSSLIASS